MSGSEEYRRTTSSAVVLQGLLALGTCVGLLVTGYHVAFLNRVPPGYYLGTRHLVGMTKEQAKAAIASTFHADQSIRFVTSSSVEERPLEELGLRYDTDHFVETLIDTSNPVDRLSADWRRLQQPEVLTGNVTSNDAQLDEALRLLAQAFTVGAEDAGVGFHEDAGRYELIPAKSGTTVDLGALELRVREAVAQGQEAILVPTEPVLPLVNDALVQSAIDEANRWLTRSITVDLLGQQRALPSSVIRAGIAFIGGETDGQPTFAVTINEEQLTDVVAAFVKGVPQSERVIDQDRLRTQIATAIRADTPQIVAASYIPRPTVVRTKSGSTATPTTSGSYRTPDGNHDAGGAGRAVAYTIFVEESVAVDPNEFAATVDAILDDERSWRGGGRLHFLRVASGGFPLYLVTPPTVDRLCAPLDTNGFTSCSINGRVVINADRWLTGSPYFTGSLSEYRAYLINHEVGHRIGLRHHTCPGSGTAPVMHQQTLGMGGCDPGPWPLEWEREKVQ